MYRPRYPEDIDPDEILEADLLRWALTADDKKKVLTFLSKYVYPDDFKKENGDLLNELYYEYLYVGGERLSEYIDFILKHQKALSKIIGKRIDRHHEKEAITETLQRLVTRRWMPETEKVRLRIQSGLCEDEEAMVLTKKFSKMKQGAPKVTWDDY